MQDDAISNRIVGKKSNSSQTFRKEHQKVSPLAKPFTLSSCNFDKRKQIHVSPSTFKLCGEQGGHWSGKFDFSSRSEKSGSFANWSGNF